MVDNIGKKIRELRLNRKITQEKLAEELDVSIQQLHKYEAGKNRIAIEKLIRIANKFGVDLNYFADDMMCRQDESAPVFTREEEEVVKIYRNIQPDKLREMWLTIGTELSKCTIKDNQKIL
ncbi:helix-turn-helix transcriptional regulator [Desulfobacterales bacterium HSG2]|nr:helix-turn-helix transcriptional regulator [Desulfobacterales bacterium HSG2]